MEEKQTHETKSSLKRRQLLQMGWTIPVVAAMSLKAPNKAFAQSIHTDGFHHDDGHVDSVHADNFGP